MYKDTSLLSIADNLIKTGRSGLIALCGDPTPELDFKYIVYFHSLGIVYISRGDRGTEYFDSNARVFLGRSVKDFSDCPDCQTVADVTIDEKAFLKSALARLLWDMTHDESDIPSCSDEEKSLSKVGLRSIWALDSDKVSFVDDTFTLFGSGDLEKDIEDFKYQVNAEKDFSVAGQSFSLGSIFEASESMLYILGRHCPEIFDDEATGERVSVTRVVETLSSYDWRTLYARARTFIYWNYVNQDNK